ncbi:hypothetical protein PENSTE_c001G09315 [Penicillium steckii]|uniref:SGNH hydrolase-type esterase domain-containing protein n=1 Tax=Penicillium steckii TaxID=303698 RepID=A0A1V6U0Z2_9EURO|nr:hypothetical protein PENSTE_c001G09315 [Penicillium steckii]
MRLKDLSSGLEVADPYTSYTLLIYVDYFKHLSSMMDEKISILCFGNSLTAGYHCFGLEYHPYAEKLKETIQAVRPNTDITTDVEGLPGDLVTSPGAFLRRLQGKLANKQYDWVIFLGGTKCVLIKIEGYA